MWRRKGESGCAGGVREGESVRRVDRSGRLEGDGVNAGLESFVREEGEARGGRCGGGGLRGGRGRSVERCVHGESWARLAAARGGAARCTAET